ncbi:COP9 signalosome complex subunit 7 isoform X1 [Bradysia coprophila]|uniref:COP9 signalosome complex subunit 7 isoform X1 n=1 Tax=Bradysia coprophila TaxID=38358 RepID=UPI00187D910B|nr:COP9 signalosome complex subunit 7 isoform X1 [Bradysia coprophila]
MSVMTDDIESIIPAATHNPLEQFVLLAKSAKGAACLDLIKQVLEAPGVHVFGELLVMPNIIELENGPNSRYFNTLKLFAYGTYKQYLDNKEQLLELSPLMIKKLQHLTIVTMAIRSKVIPYKDLLVELDIKNVRDLEDLIIESIYADIIHGKLDQRNSQLEVDYAIGRDIQWNDIGNISATLREWCDSCETVLSCIEKQIERANLEKARRTKHKETIEQEIQMLKTSLKSQLPDGDDAPMSSDTRDTSSSDNRKKGVKPKGNKPTSKLWF